MLQTRVRELDVINDLFRGRVTELETSQQDARNKEQFALKAEQALRAELDAVIGRETNLKRRVDDLEGELAEYKEGRAAKKMRLSDLVDDGSQVSTPSTPS